MFSCNRTRSPSGSATTCCRSGAGQPEPGRNAPSTVWTCGLPSSGKGRKSGANVTVMIYLDIAGPARAGHPLAMLTTARRVGNTHAPIPDEACVSAGPTMTTAVLPPTPCPTALGYRMPAEWEPHQAIWIAWPHQRDDWPGQFEPIPWVYAEIVRRLHRSEQVRILALSGGRSPGTRDAAAGRRRSGPGAFRALRHRPRLDCATRPRSSSGRARAGGGRWTGASTPGPSTTTGSTTMRCRRGSPSISVCRAGSRRSTGGAWCWKGAASTSTARGCC